MSTCSEFQKEIDFELFEVWSAYTWALKARNELLVEFKVGTVSVSDMQAQQAYYKVTRDAFVRALNDERYSKEAIAKVIDDLYEPERSTPVQVGDTVVVQIDARNVITTVVKVYNRGCYYEVSYLNDAGEDTIDDVHVSFITLTSVA